MESKIDQFAKAPANKWALAAAAVMLIVGPILVITGSDYRHSRPNPTCAQHADR